MYSVCKRTNAVLATPRSENDRAHMFHMHMPACVRLRDIKTFPQLVTYLREELDWPLNEDDFDQLTFEYQPADLGLMRNASGVAVD
jgi:hypothetical protein